MRRANNLWLNDLRVLLKHCQSHYKLYMRWNIPIEHAMIDESLALKNTLRVTKVKFASNAKARTSTHVLDGSFRTVSTKTRDKSIIMKDVSGCWERERHFINIRIECSIVVWWPYFSGWWRISIRGGLGKRMIGLNLHISTEEMSIFRIECNGSFWWLDLLTLRYQDTINIAMPRVSMTGGWVGRVVGGVCGGVLMFWWTTDSFCLFCCRPWEVPCGLFFINII